MVNFGEQSKENSAENLTLIKGVATDMGKYMVTYQEIPRMLWILNNISRFIFSRKILLNHLHCFLMLL